MCARRHGHQVASAFAVPRPRSRSDCWRRPGGSATPSSAALGTAAGSGSPPSPAARHSCWSHGRRRHECGSVSKLVAAVARVGAGVGLAVDDEEPPAVGARDARSGTSRSGSGRRPRSGRQAFGLSSSSSSSRRTCLAAATPRARVLRRITASAFSPPLVTSRVRAVRREGQAVGVDPAQRDAPARHGPRRRGSDGLDRPSRVRGSSTTTASVLSVGRVEPPAGGARQQRDRLAAGLDPPAHRDAAAREVQGDDLAVALGWRHRPGRSRSRPPRAGSSRRASPSASGRSRPDADPARRSGRPTRSIRLTESFWKFATSSRRPSGLTARPAASGLALMSEATATPAACGFSPIPIPVLWWRANRLPASKPPKFPSWSASFPANRRPLRRDALRPP